MHTLPPSGRSRPAIKLRMVVLPQPDGPTRQTSSPRATVRLTSRKAAVTPRLLTNVLSTARSSITLVSRTQATCLGAPLGWALATISAPSLVHARFHSLEHQ